MEKYSDCLQKNMLAPRVRYFKMYSIAPVWGKVECKKHCSRTKNKHFTMLCIISGLCFLYSRLTLSVFYGCHLLCKRLSCTLSKGLCSSTVTMVDQVRWHNPTTTKQQPQIQIQREMTKNIRKPESCKK